MKVPEGLHYTDEHEWVRVKEGQGTVGITDYAQSELGDVVYVELPKVDQVLRKGDQLGVVESVKAVSDVYAPVSGRVTAVNGDLGEKPELVNQSPYEQGWMVRIELSDETEVASLMAAGDYSKFIAKEKGSE